jgi:hypothetical protein
MIMLLVSTRQHLEQLHQLITLQNNKAHTASADAKTNTLGMHQGTAGTSAAQDWQTQSNQNTHMFLLHWHVMLL